MNSMDTFERQLAIAHLTIYGSIPVVQHTILVQWYSIYIALYCVIRK